MRGPEFPDLERLAGIRHESSANEAPDAPTFVTKDSGHRQDYASGMVRDLQDGKPNFSLITPIAVPFSQQMLTRWAALMARGADKYGLRNWEKANSAEELERFKSSAFRHFMQWLCDAGDGEDHAAAVYFNIQCAEYVKLRRTASTSAPVDDPDPGR